MLNINEKDLADYQENGFVISKNFLSNEIMSNILKNYDSFIKLNPNLTLEEMSSPHLVGGVGMKHKIDKEISNSFLEIGKDKEIVSLIMNKVNDFFTKKLDGGDPRRVKQYVTNMRKIYLE